MIEDTPGNKAMEKDQQELRPLTTTVFETVQYALKYWADAENVRASKNATNQLAKADLELDGKVLATEVPVDELMGLEDRLSKLKAFFTQAPSLDASKTWVPAPEVGKIGAYGSPETYSTKTAKVMTPVVLAAATDKHPAQVKESTADVVVGMFTTKIWSGAMTTQQKADVLALLDKLTVAAKQARNRANTVEVVHNTIGNVIVGEIMKALTPQ